MINKSDNGNKKELDYKMIGMRIRNLRKNRGISQEELAESVDISATHISHIENGSTKLSLTVLVNIASVLSVQIDELLFDHVSSSSDHIISNIIESLSSCSKQQLKIINEIMSATIKSLNTHLNE